MYVTLPSPSPPLHSFIAIIPDPNGRNTLPRKYSLWNLFTE